MIMSGGSKQPSCLPRCDRCFSVLFRRSSSAVACLLVKRLSHGRKCLQPCCCPNSQGTKAINCAKYPAARAANPGADSPAGTINTTADGATGIINTAADTPPVHPEMDNEICEARVGSSCHAAWVLHVIRFGLEPYPRNPRNRRAIIIGGSIPTHLKLLEALDSIIERFGHA